VGKINLKHNYLLKALKTLKNAIDNLKKIELIDKNQKIGFLDHEEAYRSFRDSLIQRFEISTDLFWKYLKIYLEDKIKIIPEANVPKPVIKATCKAKLISEKDSEMLLEMIQKRNLTSHIYKEEIADIVCKGIPTYFELMDKYSKQLTP
jgi:nucleotidyltransferase substrate binding protein (TIGR01987 family)